MMEWKGVLAKLAPTVLSGLLGPAGGAVAALVGSALGLDAATQNDVQNAIERGNLTGDQIASIKELELKLQAEEKERGFRYAELEFKDRDSARGREEKTGDQVNRNLAYFVVGSFVAVVISTLAGWTNVDSVLAGTLIGYLSAKAEQVMSYYFGSSQGSEAKTRLLAQAQPVEVKDGR